MAPLKSSRKTTKDLISNLPGLVTDKILELLPIRMAARTSALSKQWNRNWVSLKCLNFNEDFCDELYDSNKFCDWQQCSNIISRILFHHDGPVHEFNLYIPQYTNGDCSNHSQWLSFLSKNEVKKIKIDHFDDTKLYLSSHIFCCSELVELELLGIALNPPPRDFNGFPKLQQLVLSRVEFTSPTVFYSLMAKCRVLVTLRLEQWSGIDNIVINVPSLQTLIVNGGFVSLSFKDVCNLKSISVCLRKILGKPMTIGTVGAINLLTNSSQLQCIQFGGDLCKFLAAGGKKSSLPVTFKHLNKLSLNDLDFDDDRVQRYVFDMVDSCPYMKELHILIKPRKIGTRHKLEFKNNYRLDHLVEVEITGITGTSAELKLIEYLLAISTVLEKLVFKCGKLDTNSEMELLRALMRFPRASSKACLISCK